MLKVALGKQKGRELQVEGKTLKKMKVYERSIRY